MKEQKRQKKGLPVCFDMKYEQYKQMIRSSETFDNGEKKEQWRIQLSVLPFRGHRHIQPTWSRKWTEWTFRKCLSEGERRRSFFPSGKCHSLCLSTPVLWVGQGSTNALKWLFFPVVIQIPNSNGFLMLMLQSEAVGLRTRRR